jgi:hypothetical protein
MTGSWAFQGSVMNSFGAIPWFDLRSLAESIMPHGRRKLLRIATGHTHG